MSKRHRRIIKERVLMSNISSLKKEVASLIKQRKALLRSRPEILSMSYRFYDNLTFDSSDLVRHEAYELQRRILEDLRHGNFFTCSVKDSDPGLKIITVELGVFRP